MFYGLAGVYALESHKFSQCWLVYFDLVNVFKLSLLILVNELVLNANSSIVIKLIFKVNVIGLF